MDSGALEEIEIPVSVTRIGNFAFYFCELLSKVTISEGVESIGDDAFAGCKALKKVTLPSSVKSIGTCAFKGCSALVEATVHLASIESIGRTAFTKCHADLVINLGAVPDVDTPNRLPASNGIARTATLVHVLSNTADTIIVRRVWPASTVALPRKARGLYGATYEATKPGPATLVDGTGIVQPLILLTLGGDGYPVYGCWGKAPVAQPNFKKLAAEQHPEALSELNSWEVQFPGADVATHTLDLVAVGDMIARGEFNLEEPVLLVWTENTEGSKSSAAHSADKSPLHSAVCDVCC